MTDTFTLVLDKQGSSRLAGYDLYRSKEMSGDRPVIDGFYIQRGALQQSTPGTLRLTVEIVEAP